MKRSLSPITKSALGLRPWIQGGLLAWVLLVGFSARVEAQATTHVYGASQFSTPQMSATTENFSATTVGSTTAYTTTGTMLNGNATFSGLGAGSFTTGADGNAAVPTGGAGKFLAVGNGSGQSTVTINFSGSLSGINYFGFLWGSADQSGLIGQGGILTNANTVVLNFSNNTSATYTANTLNLTVGSTNFVDFTTPANVYITQATLSYAGSAFEIDNLAFGVVPEPSTWAGGGLLVGIAAWMIRRRALQSRSV